jgi:hypothetical protein
MRQARIGSAIFFKFCSPIIEEKIDLATNLPVGIVRQADAAWLCYSLQSCCDVDAVTEYIVIVDDDIADVDSYPKLDSELLRDIGVLPDHFSLDVRSAAHRINCACEFDQHTVAGSLDNATAVARDSRIYKSSSERL